MSQDIQWITINGQHIPIGANQSKEEAIANFLADKKDKEIKRNDEIKKKLNTKDNGKADEFTQSAHQRAVKELEKDKYEDGTYDLNTMKTVEYDSGYQVTFCQIGDNYTAKEYADKVNECLKLSSDGKTCAGKFESTPEVSFHFSDREQAIAYAKANNQISIWDWGSASKGDYEHAEIKTGGTGKRK